MKKWLTKNGVLAEKEVIAISVWGLGRNGFNYSQEHYFCTNHSLKLVIKSIKKSVANFGNHCIYIKVSVDGKVLFNGNIKKWKK